MSFRSRLALLTVIATAFALLPTAFFDDCPTLCLYKLLTGRDCWGCGTLHALSGLFHCEFANAFRYNHCIIVTSPLMLVVSLRWLCGKYEIQKNGECHDEDSVDR